MRPLPYRGGGRPFGHVRLNTDSPQTQGLSRWWPHGQLVDLVVGDKPTTAGFASQSASALGTAYAGTGSHTVTYAAHNLSEPSITLAVWLDVASWNTSWERLVDWSFNDGTGEPYTIAQIVRYGGGDSLYFGWSHSGSLVSLATYTITPPFRDVHVALVISPSRQSAFINGQRIGGTTHASGFNALGYSSSQIKFVRFGTGSTNYSRSVQGDVRTYKRALSDQEIWNLYAPETRWDLYAPV